MEEKKKKGILSGIMEKADKRMEEKAKDDCGCGCCCGPKKEEKDRKEGCCG